jgi:hypothetical protein
MEAALIEPEHDTEAQLPAMLAKAASLLPAPLEKLQEVANFMASAGPMVGAGFQKHPQRCLAIAYQAARWGLDPVAVSQKAYVTEKNGVERIGYEAQLVASIINTRAPLARGEGGARRPIEIDYYGEGAARYCVVTGYLEGSDKPRRVSSPTVANIKPKNSPLWFSDPDQQLAYYTQRAWARRWCPQVLLGIYTPEELSFVQVSVADVTPKRAADLYDDTPPEEIEVEVVGHPSDGEPFNMVPDKEPDPEPSGGVSFKSTSPITDNKPGPSGGRAHKNRDNSKKEVVADLGPNPWHDVDDIMEWVVVFGGEVERAEATADLDKLIQQAMAHGMLPRLKRASAEDFKTLSDKAKARRVELEKDAAE